MTSKKGFKTIATILTTAIFGYLGYLLYNAAASGKLFLNNDDSMLIETIIVFAPFLISIIWGRIRHRKIWIGALLTMLACTGINTILGEDTTPNHVPLFIACLVLPYLLCLFAIISEKRHSETYEDTYTSDSSYSYSSYSDSGSTPSTDDCGAYGYPADRGPSYNPGGSIDVSDM